MQVYTLHSGEVQHFRPQSAGWEQFWSLKGSPCEATWTPVEMSIVAETADREPSDFPHLSPGVPVFSQRAVEVLGPVLTSSGELLPVTYNSIPYFVLHVTKILDALDEEHSVVRRFSDGKIAGIKAYAFFPDRIADVPVFRIPQKLTSTVFVTDSFVEAVNRAGLTGFKFTAVWTG